MIETVPIQYLSLLILIANILQFVIAITAYKRSSQCQRIIYKDGKVMKLNRKTYKKAIHIINICGGNKTCELLKRLGIEINHVDGKKKTTAELIAEVDKIYTNTV